MESGRNEYWEERLYHQQVDYQVGKDDFGLRAIATLLEIDYLSNWDIVQLFSVSENGDPVNDVPCQALAFEISKYIKNWFSN